MMFNSKYLSFIIMLIIIISIPSRIYCGEKKEDEAKKPTGFWGINYEMPEMDDEQGIILTYILPGGPADRAGLKVNDLLIKINNESVNQESFAKWTKKSKVDDELDLVVIRSGDEFTTTIVLSDVDVEMAPRGYKRHYTEMKSLGTYIVMLPPDYDESEKAYPLCLILHGRGSTEIRHGKLADQLGREGVIYVAPRYPYPFVDVFIENQQEGWSGYPPYDFGEDESYYPIIDNLGVDWIFDCVKEARTQYRIAGERVFILGHSQGAFFTMACAASHPGLVESYLAFAPFVPEFYISKDILRGLKEHNVKVYLAHGSEDKVLDIEHSEKAAKAMEEVGVNYVFKKFKAGHSFSDEIYAFAREWLDSEVRPDKD